jgi:hypothetical protein
MADLSPAAQAVWLAAWEHSPINCKGLEDRRRQQIAAALRAAADQIQMKEPFGNTDADAGVFAAHQAIHAGFLAIAAELEGQ